jgi:hypothetical protein
MLPAFLGRDAACCHLGVGTVMSLGRFLKSAFQIFLRFSPQTPFNTSSTGFQFCGGCFSQGHGCSNPLVDCAARLSWHLCSRMFTLVAQ